MRDEIADDVFLRPRFEMKFEQNPIELIEQLQVKVKETSYKFKIVDQHVVIDVSAKDNHFWSPQLNLEFLAVDDGGTILKVLFGPKPQVWTFFMFCHFVVGIAFLVSMVMLYVKWALKSDFGLTVFFVIGMPVIWILLYVLGRIGRSFGRKQMADLHSFMLGALAKT